MAYNGLIVGLGNPGVKYSRTRHNFGFLLADRLLRAWEAQPGAACDPRRAKNAEVWSVTEEYGARQWLLVKPLTFMNLSGQAVSELSRKNGITPEQVLILHDELDLPLGTLRFKFSGGLAGHNGLKSVAAHLGTRDFARLRLGIGRPTDGESPADYVLRGFAPDEWNELDSLLTTGAEAVLDFCRQGLDAAMATLHTR